MRRNIENDIKALDGNRENLSDKEKELLQTLKNLQTTQDKINELKKIIQAIREKSGTQATSHDRVHEMSS